MQACQPSEHCHVATRKMIGKKEQAEPNVEGFVVLPVLSILLAVFMVSPNKLYLGSLLPISPDTTSPGMSQTAKDCTGAYLSESLGNSLDVLLSPEAYLFGLFGPGPPAKSYQGPSRANSLPLNHNQYTSLVQH